jgi:O-antigen ligase
MVVAATALMLTFSRGSWLALLAAAGLLALLYGPRAFAFVLVASVVVALVLPERVTDKINTTFKEEERFADENVELDNSTQGRLDRWRQLPGHWLEAPCFGHGFQSYARVSGRIGRYGEARGAHSTIIALLVDQGLFGFIGYVWLMWLLFRGAWWNAHNADDAYTRALGLGFVCVVFALILLDLTGARFRDMSVMAYVWVLGGGLVRLQRNKTDPRPVPVARINGEPGVTGEGDSR